MLCYFGQERTPSERSIGDRMKKLLRTQFRGTISNQTEAACANEGLKDQCDLVGMARLALNYLRGNPDPARGFECKFTLGPLGIPCHFPEHLPPDEFGYDTMSLGDTDARMATQYAHVREMTGDPEADTVEKGVIGRVLGYLREDGYAWVAPTPCTGKPADSLWIGSWTTAKSLCILSELWHRTGDRPAKKRARKIFEALRDLAQWDGNKAWYMGVVQFRDGQWLMEGGCRELSRNYPFIVEPLVRYWECTGDEEGLDLARAFTEGFLAGSQPDMGPIRIDNETGAFQSHVHLHTHAMWGVAHLGALLNEPRYLQLARNCYEFVRANGTDYGWYPEFIPQQEYRTEICVVGDMVSIAAWLARAGEPHYWDHVERTVRNELRRSQFLLTPAFMELFTRLHSDKPSGVVDEAIGELRKLEGGFVAQATFDDWVGYPSDEMGKAGIARNGIHMMGCCPPEGMRGLYEAWCGTVEELDDGAVYINMPFNREHPVAVVTAYAPDVGRVDVEAIKPAGYYLRLPAWASRTEAKVARNGASQTPEWSGPANAYVVVRNVKKGDRLTLTWPVPTFIQTIVPTSVPDRADEISIQWVGNTVQNVQPPGPYLPMFQNDPK